MPRCPGRSHRPLVHALLQHTSSTQKPVAHSAGVEHAPPCGTGVLVGVAVGVLVAVEVLVTVEVLVAVAVVVAVAVLVAVCVTVPVALLVAVAVAVAVAVLVPVGVAVGVLAAHVGRQKPLQPTTDWPAGQPFRKAFSHPPAKLQIVAHLPGQAAESSTLQLVRGPLH